MFCFQNLHGWKTCLLVIGIIFYLSSLKQRSLSDRIGEKAKEGKIVVFILKRTIKNFFDNNLDKP